MDGKVEAIMLTLGDKFLKKVYPGGEAAVRVMLERMNDSDDYKWMQFCGSGLPTIDVKIYYVCWGGKVQYSCEIDRFVRNSTGSFGDGGVVRTFKKRNLCVLRGPTIPAPYDIPKKGFQGFRYSPFLF